MRIRYDLHVHSALSPCADDNMSPVMIVGYAKLAELDAVAVADHNAIGNVEVAVAAGKAYGVCVVPAMELQTAEDIHVLCLFDTFEHLSAFYDTLEFPKLRNKPEVFGNQLLYDEDDNVVGTEPRLLHIGANIAVENVPFLAERYGGVAVAAHVDREENGMVAVLGRVIDEYSVAELSLHAEERHKQLVLGKSVITNSDAHWLERIGKANGTLDVTELTPEGVIRAIKSNN